MVRAGWGNKAARGGCVKEGYPQGRQRIVPLRVEWLCDQGVGICLCVPQIKSVIGGQAQRAVPLQEGFSVCFDTGL